jgi:hypothetical protein
MSLELSILSQMFQNSRISTRTRLIYVIEVRVMEAMKMQQTSPYIYWGSSLLLPAARKLT